MSQINVYKERWDEDAEERLYQLFSRRYRAEVSVPDGFVKRKIVNRGFTPKGALKKVQRELKIREEYPGGSKLVQIWTEPGERVQ